MRKVLFAGTCVAGFAVMTSAFAQAPMPFEDAVYVTCREANEMPREKRTALILQLADHAAARQGIRFRDNEKVEQELAQMIRSGCTMFPNATAFFIVSSAVKAEAESLRPTKK